MLKTKFVIGTDLVDLNETLNKTLSEIKASGPPRLNYFLKELVVVIEYEVEEAYVKSICAECQYWDDGDSTSSIYGICQFCGVRKRFSSKACDNYLDIRA